MRLRLRSIVAITAFVCAAVLVPASSGAGKPKKNPAVQAFPQKSKHAQARHQAILQRVKKGNVDIVFLGDSITEGWLYTPNWKSQYEPLKAANLGISSDRTNNVLWRITKGNELQGIKPKVAVIMIGTNNIGSNTPAQIADAVGQIVQKVQDHNGSTKVLLLGVLPRRQSASHPDRKIVRDINLRLAMLAASRGIVFQDLGRHFLDGKGNIPKSLMSDYVHPTRTGYGIWAKAMEPTLRKLLN